MDDREMVVSPHVRNQLLTLKLFVGSLIVGIVAAAIWKVWDQMTYVGYFAIAVVVVGLTCAMVVPVIAIIKWAFRPSYQDVGEWGGYFTGLFGRVSAAPPMAATPIKQVVTKKKMELTPILPGIVEMIEQGTIRAGIEEMVIGYTLKGKLIMAGWPGTFAVAGLGRSGKTRRVIMIVIQALIAGARVTLCDPHYEKPDSLGKQLIALHPWLYCLATTDEECITASREFLAEMKARKGKSSQEWNGESRGIPRVIIYDEWPYLMQTDSIEDENRKVMIEVAEDCSTQYAGFDGFAGLVGQKWTESSVGSTDIRRSLHLVFIHQLSAEYVNFFISRAKWKNRASEMPKRHCIFNNSGEIMEVVTPDVPDDAAIAAAELLATLRQPEKQYRLSGPSVKGSLSSPSQKSELNPDFYSERTESLKWLPERAESTESLTEETEKSETFTESLSGDTFTIPRYVPNTPPAPPEGYTEALEARLALAYAELSREGVKVTREAVKARIGKGNHYHPHVKYFFDHRISQN